MDEVSEKKGKIEILAPAGSKETALAAANAGADAVYFGLPQFNARRGAENISFDDLPELVNTLHTKNVKAYLALNIDISQRELAEAARYYGFAKFANVDAVIVKDLCFWEFQKYLGEIPLHLSTQAAISNSYGAKFAKATGIKRIILARELSKFEINAVAERGIEVEIFALGAMCFCISGRCLLSSWIGGRSGNRGLCASPCRMEWKDSDGICSRLMSMKDLSLLNHINEIQEIGVTALKIEGRLKNPEWVANAVKLLKDMRDSKRIPTEEELSRLTDYAGRALTDAFFIGKKDSLITDSARPKSGELSDKKSQNRSEIEIKLSLEKNPTKNELLLSMTLFDPRQNCEFRNAVPLKRREPDDNKYYSLNGRSLIARLSSEFPDIFFDASELFGFYLFSKRNFEDAKSAVSSLVNKLTKEKKEVLKFKLPDELLQKIRATVEPCEIRRGKLGFEFVRISSAQSKLFEGKKYDCKFIVECSRVENAKFASSFLGKDFIAALPQVFYESQIEEVRNLLSFCIQNQISIELNNLESIALAKECGVKEWSAGPGLMILNSFSAEFLKGQGACSAVVSLEADAEKIEELLRSCALPLCIYVFGRPRLMQSRCEFNKDRLAISERRGLELMIIREGEISKIYPVEPFYFPLPSSTPANFAIDLVFSPDPLRELRNWRKIPSSLFNLSRRLR